MVAAVGGYKRVNGLRPVGSSSRGSAAVGGMRRWDRSNLKGQRTVAVPAYTGSLHAGWYGIVSLISN